MMYQKDIFSGADLLTSAEKVLASKYRGHAACTDENLDVCAEENQGHLHSQYRDRLSLLEAIGDLSRELLGLVLASVRSPYQTASRTSLPQCALLQLAGQLAAFVDEYVDDERRSADGS